MIAKKSRRIAVAAVSGLVVALAGASVAFAGNVTETRPDCVDASVVLLGDSAAPDRIRQFVDARHGIYDFTPVSWEMAYPVSGVTTAYGVKS